MKRSTYVLVFSLSVVSLTDLNGCDRQVPPPKAVKEPAQIPDTEVGGMAGSAIAKPKGLRPCWDWRAPTAGVQRYRKPR
jgi:hypothetical protein